MLEAGGWNLELEIHWWNVCFCHPTRMQQIELEKFVPWDLVSLMQTG